MAKKPSNKISPMLFPTGMAKPSLPISFGTVKRIVSFLLTKSIMASKHFLTYWPKAFFINQPLQLMVRELLGFFGEPLKRTQPLTLKHDPGHQGKIKLV